MGLSLIAAWCLFCLSLAGPTWQKLPQAVHKEDSAMVLILDLSPSMLAEDLSPSRLVRARYKLMDILNSRQQGFTGLVVYGGQAHSVSPLTDDTDTIISLAPTLHPTLLPQYGSNTEDAIATAILLAENGGYQEADLLLITDGVDPSAHADIRSQIATKQGLRLFIMGVGTEQGAPIPTGNGSFVKDSNGAILVPKLNSTSLQSLAASANGYYQTLTSDDSDISNLLAATEQLLPSANKALDRTFDLWLDEGFWLIIFIIPLLVLSFRKGIVFIIVLAPITLTSPMLEASIWQDLWYTPDQQGENALQNGDAELAKSLFKNQQWQASAAYKSQDYETAAANFKQGKSADAHYNLGNALARLGDLEGAIKAYDQALAMEPDMQDAIANRELVEQLKQQQQNQQQNQNQEQQQQDQDQQQNQQQQQNQEGQQSQEQDQQQQQQNEQNEQNEQEQQKNQSKQPKQELDKQQQAEQEKEEQEKEKQKAEKEKQKAEQNPEQAENEQEQQQLEQWLRRVPDDPGGLLRQKFRYQSQQRAREQRRPQPPNQQERW
jgi:Ca-activated chloride channel family protein